MLRHIDLATLSPAERSALTTRSAVPDPSVREAAADICEQIRTGGDQALDELSARFGGGRPGGARVSAGELRSALDSVAPDVRAALEMAVANVEAYHRAQLPGVLTVETRPGVTVERRWSALTRVGCYVPGGKAAYPSSLIMTAVPARVAGVDEIVVATPAAPDGTLDQTLLAAAALVGVTEVYAMGGAQAVAALAYGTGTIPRVQKIVGPGNAWVTAAKLHVYGTCAIDLPAGPSEVLVIADSTADPHLVAIDLLCQAEHGPDSPALLVTTDPNLLLEVEGALADLLPGLQRSEILAKALADHGLAIVARDLATAVEFANQYAPEHVTVLTDDATTVADQVTGAGSVYVGEWSPESAGDYATGANHVLPTGGLAAACGPLSVEDFGSWRQIQTLTQEGLTALSPTITTLAAAEGLTAHGLACTMRFERNNR
ncbi:MAG: histidinol dehydrogenase [Acidimicrobiia bacterium]|nr:histidinol dehydrogenase [Acidimicrobiia bacterium]